MKFETIDQTFTRVKNIDPLSPKFKYAYKLENTVVYEDGEKIIDTVLLPISGKLNDKIKSAMIRYSELGLKSRKVANG